MLLMVLFQNKEFKMEVFQERNYNILENFDGNLLILLKARTLAVPRKSHIEYDGGEHAILYRGFDLDGNNEIVVILDYVNKNIREKLYNSENVLVVETFSTDDRNAYGISNEYNCTVQRVDKIDLSKYNVEYAKPLTER